MKWPEELTILSTTSMTSWYKQAKERLHQPLLPNTKNKHFAANSIKRLFLKNGYVFLSFIIFFIKLNVTFLLLINDVDLDL